MVKEYYVGVSHPYLSEKFVLEVQQDVDAINPGLVLEIDDVNTPLDCIKAKSKKEAISIYYKRHPKIKKTIASIHINVKNS